MMWISRKRYKEIEFRLQHLERHMGYAEERLTTADGRMKVVEDRTADHSIGKFGIDFRYIQLGSISQRDLILKILTHLGLNLKAVKGTDPQVILAKVKKP